MLDTPAYTGSVLKMDIVWFSHRTSNFQSFKEVKIGIS